MTRKEKLLKKFLERPERLKFREIRKLLKYLGFREVSARGSHRKFKHPEIRSDLIVSVHGRDCKKVYKRYFSQLIKEKLL